VEIEVGYRLARAFWGRGLATEAAEAVRDYAFRVLALPRLVAIIDPRNRPSIRVAEKTGLWYEKEVLFRGNLRHLHVINRAGLRGLATPLTTRE
jgi:RimJ/RimL family protein N-acetyltransferase